MSWDASLHLASRPDICIGDWNYTHNTNSMILAAYELVTGNVIGTAWWHRLNEASGEDGREYLSQIIKGLEAQPERFRLANPPNGWGDYDSLLKVLREMRDRVPAEPAVWQVSG